VQLDRARPDLAASIIDSVDLQSVEDPIRRSVVLVASGRLAFHTGRFEAARSVLTEARRLREQAGSPAWVLEADLDLARVDLVQGHAAQVTATASKLIPATRDVGEFADSARSEQLWIASRLALGDVAAARQRLGQVAQTLGEQVDLSIQLEHELLGLVVDGANDAALRALAARARESGRGLMALRIELAAADGSSAKSSAIEQIRSAGLADASLRLGVAANRPVASGSAPIR
jgi:hypothetical protein